METKRQVGRPRKVTQAVIQEFDKTMATLQKKTALQVQPGGDHYKNFKIQPVEFIVKNDLSFLQGCIIKRICRYKEKGGLLDLEKIKHEVDLLIQLEVK